jgi:hypothetical protein
MSTHTEDPDLKPFDVALITDMLVGMGGFVWANTPQGHDYWERVERNLQIVLEIAKAKEKAGG